MVIFVLAEGHTIFNDLLSFIDFSVLNIKVWNISFHSVTLFIVIGRFVMGETLNFKMYVFFDKISSKDILKPHPFDKNYFFPSHDGIHNETVVIT